jgi:hypothetical protein
MSQSSMLQGSVPLREPWDYSMQEVLAMEPLISRELLVEALKRAQLIDRYGPDVFITKNFLGHETVSDNYPFYLGPNGDYTAHSETFPGRFPARHQTTDEHGQVITVGMKVFFRTFREILWPNPELFAPVDGLTYCTMVARLERHTIPNESLCCSKLTDELFSLQLEWLASPFYDKLVHFLQQGPNLRRIDSIVCYQLGRLSDPGTGKPNSASLFRHLTAFTIARILNDRQKDARPKDLNIKLFAEDDQYCSSCQKYLREKIGHDGVRAPHWNSVQGFQFAYQLESFLADKLHGQTLFITFTPREYALVPAYSLTHHLYEGPAALLCRPVTGDGTKSPLEQSKAASGKEAWSVDSSPLLYAYIKKVEEQNNVFELDDSDNSEHLKGWAIKEDEEQTTIVPKLYYRTDGKHYFNKRK